MHWLDFSQHGTALLYRQTSQKNYFVAAPIEDAFPAKVKQAFLTLGFIEEESGKLVAPITAELTQRLTVAKHVKKVNLDKSFVFEHLVELSKQKSGDQDESHRNDERGQGALEGVLAGTLPGDGGFGGAGDGTGSGGEHDPKGNGSAQDGGDVGGGGLDRGEDVVSDHEAVGPVSSGDEAVTPDEWSGTRGDRLRDNMAAIRLLKQLENEGRAASADEKQILSRFTGWGALKNVFNPISKSRQDREAFAELTHLLSEEEMLWAQNGVLAQFFTSNEVIEGVYDILEHMGFTGGNVIEPSVGTGRFIGLMPESMRQNSQWYAAEIDPTPGKITQYLYGSDTVQVMAGVGFQNAELAYGKFDLAIGNPPFGDERIADNNEARKAIDRFKIHNYILAKSAMHLKDDGVMAMIVTHRFLDAKDDEARRFLAENFDLLTAIRLPNNTFESNAGTEVTTDLVFFKRRAPDMEPGDQSWLKHDGVYIDSDGAEIPMNQWFVEHPELMLGKPSLEGTMYAGDEKEFTLHPHEGMRLAEQFDRLIQNELSHLQGILTSLNGVSDTQEDGPGASLLNNNSVGIGGFIRDEYRRIWMREDNDNFGNTRFVRLTPEMPWTEKTQLGEKRYNRIVGMLNIREKAYELINAEKQDAYHIEDLRVELNDLYDRFVAEFGYINDSANASLIDGDAKIEFGLEKNYKAAVSAAKAKKRGGSEAIPSTAEKADILLRRVFFPYKEIESAENPEDGYSISMSEKGRLDLDYIADLTGLSKDEVIHGLSDRDRPLIFKDPETDTWVQEDEYLSGNVKRKLREARMLGEEYRRNVEALEKVLPKDVAAADIFIGIGQTWIPQEIYEQFLIELGVKSPRVVIIEELGTVNVVSSGDFLPTPLSDALVNKYIKVSDMFNFIANKKAITIWVGEGDGRVVDVEATRDANLVAKKMGLIFKDWIFADESRRIQLEALYNETQNTTVDRRFDGKHLKTVGASPSIMLRNTQRNAAWRMIQSTETLLDHVVGAGKTYTLIAGIMERKRLGLSKKPMLVVPNHLVTQWAKDFLKLYPGANILAATERNFEKSNRRKLFANIATGEYDAIIIGHSSLKFIPLNKDIEVEFLMDELKELQKALNRAENNNDKRSVRTLTNRIAKRRERITALNKSKKDDVVTLDEMGVDFLGIDESHEFKNLEYATVIQRVAGMGNPVGSQKAFDLYMKLKYLRQVKESGGAIAFATGTPISNSLVEMYSIMRYLNSDGLRERRLYSFDAWIKNYAMIESRIEYTATQQLKERAVMSSFSNIPEMMQLYRAFADVITMSDLKESYAEQIRQHNRLTGENLRESFPVPKVNGGARKLQITEPNPNQIEYMDYLIERALKIEEDRKKDDFDPKIDNLLWIYSDAKKAALDIRVVDPLAEDSEYNKTSLAVKNIYDRYIQWNDDKGTQLVFSDLSTPSGVAKKNADQLLKSVLVSLKTVMTDLHHQELAALDGYQDKWSYLKDVIKGVLDSNDLDDKRRDALEVLVVNVDGEAGAFITADTGFSVYDDIKKKLVAMGIPAHEIQFIHDFDKAAQKKELYDQVNRGEVRVLLGSTMKMGAGTNAQERLVALHHIDSSMHNRPSDIDQREGRIIRQGNLLYERDPDNFEVDVIAYSTARTFDAVSWQTLARKASMLEGFRKGCRSIEEDHSDSASYMEFMAETTGNPIFKEKIALEREIEELEADQRRVASQLSSAKFAINASEEKEERLRKDIRTNGNLAVEVANADAFVFGGRRFKRDIVGIFEEELALYQIQKRAYEKADGSYKRKRKAWEAAPKGEKGEMPKKPIEPEYPSLDSARMDRSEEAQFYRTIKEHLSDEDRSRYQPFYVGDVEYNLAKHLNYRDEIVYGVSDEFGIARDDQFSRVKLSGIVNRIREITVPDFYMEKKGWLENELERHLLSTKAARRLVETTDFTAKAALLEEKNARYTEVQAIVGAIEAEEKERRRSVRNRYIERDLKRFGLSDRTAFFEETDDHDLGAILFK
jgi:N12 class adenine-specific DNA methylase